MMVVTCDNCTSRYKIDEAKIKNEVAKLTCKNCGHHIIVKNPNGGYQSAEAFDSTPPGDISRSGGSLFNEPAGSMPEEPSIAQPPAFSLAGSKTGKDESFAASGPSRVKGQGLGLKGQLFVYLFIPFLLIFAAAIIASVWQLSSLVNSIGRESSAIVTRFAENAIADNSRSVARQMRIYLDGNPGVRKEDFFAMDEVRAIALQKVGKTGYTAITSTGKPGAAICWMHPNEQVIGGDIIEIAKKNLGEEHAGLSKILLASAGGKPSQGYYLWKEPDGSVRQKFLAAVPIPNTDMVVSSTTYIDEFTLPNQQLLARVDKYKARAVWMQTAGVVVLSLLIAILVLAYGRNLTNRITRLSEVVDRISLGELEIEIETKAKDEIGQLSEAISRMQDSLRLSIERLRKRRKGLN